MTMQEKFEAWCKREVVPWASTDWYYPIWQAAYCAGQEAMRERAAKACEKHPAEFGFKPKVAASIRALPIE